MGGVPLLIRWTTDLDYPEKTEWWYCVKDTPFDINSLKSKRRYEINKGKKFFNVKEINPLNFKEEIYEIQKKAYETYPLKYQPKLIKNDLYEEIEKKWNKCKVYGAFNEGGNLCSYLILFYNNKCINF